MKVNYKGKQIDATEVDILSSKEEWNEYQLSNGDVLCTKEILVRCLKADTELVDDGEPLYIIHGQSIVKIRKAR